MEAPPLVLLLPSIVVIITATDVHGDNTVIVSFSRYLMVIHYGPSPVRESYVGNNHVDSSLQKVYGGAVDIFGTANSTIWYQPLKRDLGQPLTIFFR
jgi:hypothetical protein